MRQLKIFLILFCLIPSSILAKTSNKYTNNQLGFEVTKPSNWHFISTKQHFENLKKLKLKDEQLQEMVKKYSTAPLVTMTKYDTSYNDSNPTFKVVVRSSNRLIKSSSLETLKATLPLLQNAFKDAKIITNPKSVKISGINSAYTKIQYLLQTPDGRSLPTSSEMWIVPREHYFFMIGVANKINPKDNSKTEIKNILKSLKID